MFTYHKYCPNSLDVERLNSTSHDFYGHHQNWLSDIVCLCLTSIETGYHGLLYQNSRMLCTNVSNSRLWIFEWIWFLMERMYAKLKTHRFCSFWSSCGFFCLFLTWTSVSYCCLWFKPEFKQNIHCVNSHLCQRTNKKTQRSVNTYACVLVFVFSIHFPLYLHQSLYPMK